SPSRLASLSSTTSTVGMCIPPDSGQWPVVSSQLSRGKTDHWPLTTGHYLLALIVPNHQGTHLPQQMFMAARPLAEDLTKWAAELLAFGAGQLLGREHNNRNRATLSAPLELGEERKTVHLRHQQVQEYEAGPLFIQTG